MQRDLGTMDRPTDGLRDPRRPRCPVTGRPDPELRASISTRRLARHWRWSLGIDVRTDLAPAGTHVDLFRSPVGVDFFWPPTPGGPDFYARLHRLRWYNPADRFEFGWTSVRLPAGIRVLEVGAGARRFAQHVGHVALSTVDRFNAAPEGTFDAVCAFHVLEHVADPLEFVRDLAERLAPGGELLLSVPDRDSYLERASDLVLNAPPHHLARWSRRGLVAVLEAADLRIVELAQAPVEAWEVPLYGLSQLAPSRSASFERGVGRVVRRLGAAATALALGRRLVPAGAVGSTIVVRAGRSSIHSR